MADSRRFDILLTAEEAYPAFERLWLEAEHSVSVGFRIFDPWTTLRSDAARKIGSTWFDLIVHTLNRGVSVTIAISDFDPAVGTPNHTYTWQSVRGLIAAGEASENAHLLVVRAELHPARVGIVPRSVIWPRALKEIRGYIQRQNLQSAAERQEFLKHVPGLAPMLYQAEGGLHPRRFPPPPIVPVTHHQKMAVIDDRLLYVGGLDLDDRRFDTPMHNRPGDQTWHDLQVIVDGPAAQEAADHLRRFSAIIHGAQPAGQPKHLLRTLSARRRVNLVFLSPKFLVDELARAHHDRIRAATRLIYLETQFFRDRVLADVLARRARENTDLSLVLIVPAAPEDVAYGDPGPAAKLGEQLQAKCIQKVRQAFGDRVFIGSPAQCRTTTQTGRAAHYGAPLVYLHAKVSLFDDDTAIVSSANLNGRSMSWDTEVGIATQTTAEAKALRDRCFRHWLGDDAGPEYFDLDTAATAWARRAYQNARTAPEERKGFLLPYEVAPAAELGKELLGIPDEMV